jgi:hypothetical protein
MKRPRGIGETKSGAPKGIPDTFADQGISVVIFRVIVEPVFHFIVNAVVAQVSNADYRRDILRHVLRFTYRFAYYVNRFHGRITVERVEKYQARIQIIARAHLKLFPGSRAVTYQHHVIRESSNLDGAPADFLNHARMPLSSNRDYVAHLKRPIGLKRNSGEKISQSVLKRQAQDHTENCRRGKQCTQINAREN